MLTDLEFAVHRFAAFANEVISPAIFGDRHPLDVAAWQCSDPVPYREARQAAYQPVQSGWRWGPVWSTCWFRATGRVPESMAGETVAFRFSSGTEALLWEGAVPRCGFDRFHDMHILLDPAEGSEPIDLLIEAACNHSHGIEAFAWDPPGTRQRWRSDAPGQLQYCELAAYSPAVWRLWHRFEFARQLMAELPNDAIRTRQLCTALQHAIGAIDDHDVARTAADAIGIIERALRGRGDAAATHCFATGHAHIDSAWLWPVRETKRKCMRSFATVLRLMERHPEFRFLCSQPQQYAWLEKSSPALFEEVARRVREGRWEPAGVMWAEPDCNLPSGESLIRQILHGRRYWTERFADAAPRRYAYLPDSFGFPASLPQILVQAGLDTFITNKLAWSQVNDWPHVNFLWRGIDGTEILAHCTPGEDYNNTVTPAELRRGERNTARKTKGLAPVWLQPFGHGDGGGGPTDAMVHNILLADHCDGLPHTRFAGAHAFCDELHRRRDALRDHGEDLPVWDGELYLELHRGTYTTQAWIKRANRRAEDGMRMVEWLSFAGPAAVETDRAEQLRRDLDQHWKLLLLNQFHDILPGTSIGAVFDQAREDDARIRRFCQTEIDHAARRWARAADTTGLERPMIVFNPGSAPQSGPVDCDGELRFAHDVPALGALVVDRSGPVQVEPVRVAGGVLMNGLIEATIDDLGRVATLRRAGSDQDACDGQPLNQLVVYDDRPQSWEAWDIDEHYKDKAVPVNTPPDAWRVAESHPLRAAIEVSRPLGAHSRITQRFVLEAASPRLDIHTLVDWHESRRVLRALFPVAVRARRATYEIQFGHLQRPTHQNTPWDRAKFEVCAHRWMDLSEPGFGVALLNDCKYGHSCHNNVMGLTLLRATKHPDPDADIGRHEFTYSLMPHDGDWRRAGVDRQAERLNAPLFAMPLPTGRSGTFRRAFAPFTITAKGAPGIVVSAVKPAEQDDRIIVRLVETHGGAGRATIDWALPVTDVESVDLLERPAENSPLHHDRETRRTTLRLRPFEIHTLAARRPSTPP